MPAGKRRNIHLARKNGKVTAIAFERRVNGYMSIHLVMGIDARGEVLGVRVLAHEETPGLGDKIEVTKSDWIKNFDGRSLDNTTRTQWGVKKDGGLFDQFSGATITPRAVVKAVREGLEFFRANKQQILAGDRTDQPDRDTRCKGGGLMSDQLKNYHMAASSQMGCGRAMWCWRNCWRFAR